MCVGIGCTEMDGAAGAKKCCCALFLLGLLGTLFDFEQDLGEGGAIAHFYGCFEVSDVVEFVVVFTSRLARARVVGP